MGRLQDSAPKVHVGVAFHDRTIDAPTTSEVIDGCLPHPASLFLTHLNSSDAYSRSSPVELIMLCTVGPR